jgi:hypothetical protein
MPLVHHTKLAAPTSATGQRHQNPDLHGMSVLPPIFGVKADIRHRPFRAISDSCPANSRFDYLVGVPKQRDALLQRHQTHHDPRLMSWSYVQLGPITTTWPFSQCSLSFSAASIAKSTASDWFLKGPYSWSSNLIIHVVVGR